MEKKRNSASSPSRNGKVPHDGGTTEDDYTALLRELYSPGEWFMVPMAFTTFLGIGEAFFLAYLINESNRYKACERNGGWFFRTSRQIEHDLCLGKQQQERMIRKLKLLRVIAISYRDMPAKRYLRIDFLRIRRLVNDNRAKRIPAPDESKVIHLGESKTIHLNAPDESKVIHLDESKTIHLGESKVIHQDESKVKRHYNKDYKTTSEEEERENEHCRRSRSGGLSSPVTTHGDDESSALRFAKKLYEFLAKERKLFRAVKSLKSWTKSFLVLLHSVSSAEIEETMQWYFNHFQEDYTPEVYSAVAFCEKFPRLRSAMERQMKKVKKIYVWRTVREKKSDGRTTARTERKQIPVTDVHLYSEKDGWREER